MGFVAHLRGERSPRVMADALTLLANLEHRSAMGGDGGTSDGSGVLLQIPHAFLRAACSQIGIALPEAGQYGVGMCFLPRSAAARRAAEQELGEIAHAHGCRVLGWRDVPIDVAHIGDTARRTRPAIRQAILAPSGLELDQSDSSTFERALFVIRRKFEKTAIARRRSAPSYIASLSTRTVVYKGLVRSSRLGDFYPDLRDPRVVTGLALVHSRFSTNTFPTWARAHPYRLLCHNGEINTLKGNLTWMGVREPRMKSSRLPNIEDVLPLIDAGQSDSASLDNALELLVHGGRSLAHAMLMLIPEAWEGDLTMSAERRAFFEFHGTLMEPWDGPAAVAFTDGRHIGAMLDRNGLRPGRYVVTDDDFVILASEAGAVPVSADNVRAKGRLRPGTILMVNTTQGRLVDADELKDELAALHPYQRWLSEQRIAIQPRGPEPRQDAVPLRARQIAFGYTREDLEMILAPMATTGEEPIGSMGNDAPIAALSSQPRLLFSYFRQLFAQVTNPAIDPIREQLVMSLGVNIGPRGNLLETTAEHARIIRLDQPVLSAEIFHALLVQRRLPAASLSAVFRADGGVSAMRAALQAICATAAAAVRAGARILVLDDSAVDASWAPIPSLLAVAAVHHSLIRQRLRADASIVIRSAEAREVAHIALLIGYGASAVYPSLALESLEAVALDATRSIKGAHPATAGALYTKAVNKGLLKIMSKMGISTLQSYCGAQVYEAVGLSRRLVDRHFRGTSSPLGGVDLDVIAEDTLRRHRAAFADRAASRLANGGDYHFRADGERHAWNPATIATLQHATRTGDAATFAEFSRAANDATRSGGTLRGLLDFVERAPISVDEVEPAAAIVRRFTTGAMSFGSLSREAHETVAVAMNRLHARSNTGEGGEDRERFGTDRSSAIKQVASGRFGVTTEYLVNARELQIKIAQGAKPGEGGQLPGHKVDAIIARTRHSMPGVTLISPPPHHDIYSIEDLAQLIFDLRSVNPSAAISVKLVAESGVGTVAVGVAKAQADLITISGDSGGTGASPLSSIKHAGVPWEIGLAETQQALLLNGLRGSVRLQVDGQLKTGRDVVIGALLGADEFGFATAPLIVSGCVMMRKCHLNTCPVGVATQDPVLRAKFAGKPEHLVTYFFFVADEVRSLLARLGARTLDEIIGRTDLLRPRADHADRAPRAATLDLAPLLHVPADALGAKASRRFSRARASTETTSLDEELKRVAAPALETGERVTATREIRNVDRATGAALSGDIARRFGDAGLPEDCITFRFQGAAGQSFGAFAARGLTLELTGEANDYVGKGLSGGRIVVRPPKGAKFLPHETVIIGNTALYGATAGEAFIGGLAGERFAVRNSGATVVVEGVGDHGCEYMTGGLVVVLGRTGRNFGAGMSGGMAFVLDSARDFSARCNTALVELSALAESADVALVKRLVERHAKLTGSARARHVLAHWDDVCRDFVRVAPTEYLKALRQSADVRRGDNSAGAHHA
jgi:glutamate synthase domain-containing protein 2/glutamate synthase domain-containing protein 1/glutamate synthase domain-containing protein 3